MSGSDPLHLSIGELVAFSCRSGDLVSVAPAGPTAQEGIRAHQKLQKQRPAGSEAEYRLEVPCECEGQSVILSGRVDILHPQTDLHRPAQLDEIKTTYCAPEKLTPAVRQTHWAQLKIYGFCYLLQRRMEVEIAQEPAQVTLQMLWYNLKEKKSYPEVREYTWPELQAFAQTALATYIEWHRLWQQHRRQVRKTARALEFPFSEYRPGQRQLAVAAYRCMRDGGELVVEAPTGIGKTVSTLFPAIKAMGEDHVDQLVYLTAKNSGREVVRQTVTRLQDQGLTLLLLEIQARDKTCACALGLCSRDADGICPRTLGFFDRLPEARRQLLAEPRLTPSVVARVADELQLCPFELSLQMLPWVDLVVCDFNYVFDPLVRMNALQDQQQRRALLVDEAHNLSDRARGMYSASLTRRESRRAAAACKGVPTLRRRIQSLVRALDQWTEEQPGDQRFNAGGVNPDREVWVTPFPDAQDPESATTPAGVIGAAQKVVAAVSQLLEQSLSPPEEIRDWLRELYRFLTIEELRANEHRCLTRRDNKHAPWQEQELKWLCLNAAAYLQQCYQQFDSTILFSATLRPAGYIYQQLGLEVQSPYLQLASPFHPDQLGVYLCPYVDTRYNAREGATDALVEMVARVYRSRPGNYLVFFPSYRFLQRVAARFAERHPQIALLQQQPGASEQERTAFLDNFREDRQSLGFAIMGGIFGEGVDYVGEQLVGTIVVGVGLPQMGEEQELLRQAFDEAGASAVGSGFDIAYRYPGLTRVLQTAGRVIRTESDRGVLILADDRFAAPFYRPLYPGNWTLQTCNNGDELAAALRHFWTAARSN